jgi:hypothetical protein
VPWALLVADPPSKDVLHASYHLRLGDLALCNSGRVGLTPIFKGQMGPILKRLDETAAEADGHRGAGQPLRLELLQVVQQWIELSGVRHHQLVGPFRAYD